MSYHLRFCATQVGGSCTCPDYETTLRMVDELQILLTMNNHQELVGSGLGSSKDVRQSELRRRWWANQTPEFRRARARMMVEAKIRKAAN